MGSPEQFYRGAQGHDYFSRFPDARADILGRCFQAKMRHWIGPQDQIFEYGVGSGRNLLALEVASKAGYDVSEAARARAREAGVIVYDTLESIPREHYTVVVCHHVLEHVASPLDTLRLLRDLLKPNGRLILTVPLEGHKRGLIPRDRDPDHHLYCWTPTTLRNLIAAAGFSVAEVRRRSGAREDVFAPIAGLSWPLFELAVRAAGLLLGRGELTLLAGPQGA